MPNDDSTQNSELRGALSAGKDCPPIEQLEKLLGDAGRVSADLSRHIETCAYCKTELALLREFQSGALRESEAAPVQMITDRLRTRAAGTLPARPLMEAQEPWWKLFWTARWLSPAALAAAIVLIFITVSVQWRKSAPTLHSTSPDEEVLRSGAIAVVSPAGDLQQVPAELRWQPVPAAVKYRVRLLEVDRSELWSAETTQNHIELPAHVRTEVVPYKTLLWDVSGVDSSGRVVAESNSVRFRLLQNVYTR